MAAATLSTKGTQPSLKCITGDSLWVFFLIINYIKVIDYHPTSSFLLDWAQFHVSMYLTTLLFPLARKKKKKQSTAIKLENKTITFRDLDRTSQFCDVWSRQAKSDCE